LNDDDETDLTREADDDLRVFLNNFVSIDDEIAIIIITIIIIILFDNKNDDDDGDDDDYAT
jgi:hypothetical protein